ncbi:MAG: TRAP transporter substrate-binding protein [Desulfotomaculum sp.]|nr:TRAP transporter substrate-binding protein [Desulfotomaculum sp.]
MKRIRMLALITCMMVTMLLLTACGQQQAEQAVTEDEPQVIKLAHVVNEQDIYHVTAVKFKELLEQKTNGQIKVKIYPNAVLGDERTLIESMQIGTVDMGVITNGPIANFLPEIAIFDMPFLFADAEEAHKVLDSEVGQKVLDKLETVNLKGLAFAERGFRNLTNSVHPVNTPADIEGLKIRVMENPVYIETFQALGANTVPMAWTEALTALQQGTIDGQENPVNVIKAFKLYETQKYMSMTRHTYAPVTILMGKGLFDSFSAEEQAILVESAQIAAEYAREWNALQITEQITYLKEQGMEIIEPDLAPFRAAVQPVYEKYQERFGDLLKEIEAVKQ